MTGSSSLGLIRSRIRSTCDQVAHKKYLNDYLTGRWYGSDSRGELYNDDPKLGDARLCGTTASLCGLEAALYEKDKAKEEKAIACILMLHAWLFTQSGIPVIYSGDEIGQLNDYTYKKDPEKWADSRYLHRGKFPWEKVEKKDPISMRIGRGGDDGDRKPFCARDSALSWNGSASESVLQLQRADPALLDHAG